MQDVDKESGQVNSKCLGVPVILREIFQYFTSAELLQLSLVNKGWNYEARSLISTRGNIIASINKNQTCQDLRAFASDLRRMKDISKVVPFSGMRVSVGGTMCDNKDYCQQSPSKELLPVYEEIIEGMTWKHFSLKHLDGWEQHKSCPAFILGKKIFRKLDSVFQQLSIELQWDEAKSFKQEFLEGCYFPRLKTFLVLNEEEPCEPEWSDLIKTVVSNAPNLRVLYTKECVNLQDNLLEGSSAFHVADSTYFPSSNEIPESVARKTKMLQMNLMAFSSDFSLNRFNRVVPMLLKSSRSIMSSLAIEIIYLAPLINYGICLENVKTFTLGLDLIYLEVMQPAILRIAKSFNFTRTFPNLNTVTIRDLDHDRRRIPDEFNEMIEQVNAALKTPSQDRAVNIKHLKLWHLPSELRRSSFSLLAQIFPSVEKLSNLNAEIGLPDIRGIWADLKEVDFTLWCRAHVLRNHDRVFCGIFPQEVALLREQDEEYLRRVNIVPVMPTIAYLKELRSFQVCYEKGIASYTGPIDDPTCLFSKITPLIAFQRCPNLTVTLIAEDERFVEALSHLRPYVPIVFQERTNLSSSF